MPVKNNLQKNNYKIQHSEVLSSREKKKKSVDELIEILTDCYVNLDIPSDKFIELDLGCGKGAFTTALAEKYPERLIYAVDVMLGRLRTLGKRNIRQGVNNMKLLRSEAWYLIGNALPDSSIDRLHLLCPDPWPKEKHKGNRLISNEFLGRLYVKLRKNGIFHFSTDDVNYYSQAIRTISNSKLFVRDDETISDIFDIKTDFENKWNEQGLKVNHCGWIKINN